MKLKAFFIVFEGISFGEKIKNSGHELEYSSISEKENFEG